MIDAPVPTQHFKHNPVQQHLKYLMAQVFGRHGAHETPLVQLAIGSAGFGLCLFDFPPHLIKQCGVLGIAGIP
eukprot:SAG22_NODE_511_length_9594_cov_4.553449_10_plen_73_part_00